MAESSILFLTERDVQSLLSMKELVHLIEQALGKFSGGLPGGIVQPVRSVVPVQEHGGWDLLVLQCILVVCQELMEYKWYSLNS